MSHPLAILVTTVVVTYHLSLLRGGEPTLAQEQELARESAIADSDSKLRFVRKRGEGESVTSWLPFRCIVTLRPYCGTNPTTSWPPVQPL